MKTRLLKGSKIFLKKKTSKDFQYAREQCRNIYEEEKNRERQYGCKQYKNLLEDEKQRLVNI